MKNRNRHIDRCKEWLENNDNLDLESLLQEVSVAGVDELDNGIDYTHMQEWSAVIDTDGIIAYFGNESDALRFRLDYINQILNTL